jgi:hypothetical protein
MSREKALAGGQELAEAGMIDACVIQHNTGESTGAGGVVTVTYGTAFYTGKCQVQTQTETGQSVDVGEAARIVTRRVVRLPVAVDDVLEGDLITITASLDPALVGKLFTARDIEAKTFLTARRITVLEVTS